MNLRRILLIFISLTITCSFSGCSALMMRMYGIKKQKYADDNTILHYAKRYNIPAADCYTLDTGYISFLFKMDTILFKKQIKNHYQPLQALYYNNTGNLEVFHVNCYTRGFPNLKWNRDALFAIFPPGQQAPADSILSLNRQLQLLQQLPYTASFSANQYDYVVIVYWSRFMGRQSKRLIKTIQNNQLLAGDKKVKIVYANNDNLFAITHPAEIK
ncbi:MAG TPA: hypothetical protein VFW78_05895 [Bacteroidia bacterium]|nr:hypothetical protein [Bacteroidia bacterium]